MSLHSHSYLSSFDILSDDFRRAIEYIEPTDDNLGVYSHRLYELLLRACTDFESLCREELMRSGYKKRGNLNVNDYKTLEETYELEPVYVGILNWRPAPAYVQPFAGWSTAEPPLGWYSAYNKVKHNRNAKFKQASLDNVRMALAGLFAMLACLGVIKEGRGEWWQERNATDELRERVYRQMIFSWAFPRQLDSFPHRT